ncbi:hypothetical protein KCU62_g414, partial [Aureobasidium sp. EXF-3399]
MADDRRFFLLAYQMILVVCWMDKGWAITRHDVQDKKTLSRVKTSLWFALAASCVQATFGRRGERKDPHAYMASSYSLAVSAQPESSRGIWFEFAKLLNAVMHNVHTTADRVQLKSHAFISGRNETAFIERFDSSTLVSRAPHLCQFCTMIVAPRHSLLVQKQIYSDWREMLSAVYHRPTSH